MIQREERVHAGIRASTLLLPVQPPEVHTLLFKGSEDRFFKRFFIMGIRRIIGEWRAFFRILSHRAGHLRIQFLARPHTVRRVIIERHMQTVFMQPGKQFFRFRELFPVPCIPGPSGAEARVDLRDMPVHIQHGNRQRNSPGGKGFHQFLIACLGIGVKPAPPVAQGKARNDRCRTGEMIKIPDASLIVPSIPEEIEIRAVRTRRQQMAFAVHSHGSAVIQNGIALKGGQPVLKRDLPVRFIQRPRCASKRTVHFTEMPDARIRAIGAFQRYGQSVRGKGTLVIVKAQGVCLHPEGLFIFLHGKIRHWK